MFQELVIQFQNTTDDGTLCFIYSLKFYFRKLIMSETLFQPHLPRHHSLLSYWNFFFFFFFLKKKETREKILANLANFAYDPYNYNFLRQVWSLHFALQGKNCIQWTKMLNPLHNIVNFVTSLLLLFLFFCPLFFTQCDTWAA